MQRDGRAIRRDWPAKLAPLLLGVIIAVLAAIASPASANQAYTVSDVRVQQTADTAVAAQEAAMREARSAALQQLFERLVPPNYRGALPQLSESEIDRMVTATDIQHEQMSGTTYTGTLAIAFDPAAVQHVLQSRDIPYADQVSPPLIVIPVYERAGARQLWETPNPWDSAWRARTASSGLISIVMAEGQPAEQLIISADQAMAGDTDRLRSLAQRYQARGAVVAYALFRIDPRNGQPTLETTLTGYGAAPPGPISRTFVGTAGQPGGADQAAAELTAIAVPELTRALGEAWRNQNAVQVSAVSQEILASVPLTHLGDYASMFRQLQEIPAVRDFRVAKLSTSEAVFRLSLRSSTSDAQQTFSQYGMTLAQQPSGWTLRIGG
jgi:hypothetical protein